MAAIDGVFYINDTDEATGQWSGFYVAEDSVIARLEVNEVTGTDVKADYISTAATAVKAGTLITTIGGDYFSAITLTSGSVAAIRGVGI